MKKVNTAGLSSKTDERLQKIIGNNIEKARIDSGKTYFEVAAMMGIRESDMYRYSSGRYFPSFRALVKILKFFDLTFEQLCDKNLKFSNKRSTDAKTVKKK